MSDEEVASELYIQIYDLAGGLVVDGLHHPHQASFKKLAMQPGGQGAQSIGDFTIPLYPPGSDEYAVYWPSEYSKITFGMRIEMYIGDAAGGDPDFVGIVDKINRTHTTAEITGFDWIWLLHAQLGLVGEYSYGADGGTMASGYIGVNEYQMLDDFAGNGILDGSYSNTPGSPWQQLTDEGLETWSCAVSGGSNLFMNTNNFSTAYSPVVVFHALAHFVPVGYTASAILGDFSILMGFDGVGAAAQNGWMARCHAFGNGAGHYDVIAEIWQFSGGVATLRAQTTVYTGVTGESHWQLQVIGDGREQNFYSWRVMVNGKDTVCQYRFALGTVITGYIGLRWAPTALAQGRIWVSQFAYIRRNVTGRWFQAGNISTSTGPTVPGQPVNGQSFLDMIVEGCNIAGTVYRLRPVAAFAGDRIDIGVVPTVGTDTNVGRDLTASVRFDESCIEDLAIEANMQSGATSARISGNPSFSSDSNLEWIDIPNALTIGMPPGSTSNTVVIQDAIADVAVSDFLVLRREAQHIVGLKSVPNQAKSLIIRRTPRVADKFRELDLVMVNDPLMGVIEQPALIVGYTFQERSTRQEVFVDQVSWRDQFQVENERRSQAEILQMIFGARP